MSNFLETLFLHFLLERSAEIVLNSPVIPPVWLTKVLFHLERSGITKTQIPKHEKKNKKKTKIRMPILQESSI